MKKIALCILSMIFATVLLCGCTTKTEYDNKEVVKIETYLGGEVIAERNRTFDFTSCTVTDTAIISEGGIEQLLENYNRSPESYPEYESAEAYEVYLRSYYNTPREVATFTPEQADALMKEVISLGIYNWKEHYENNDFICGSWSYIHITFTDGTVKSTSFYYKYPKNYEKIENAFHEFFGVGLYATQ